MVKVLEKHQDFQLEQKTLIITQDLENIKLEKNQEKTSQKFKCQDLEKSNNKMNFLVLKIIKLKLLYYINQGKIDFIKDLMN